MAGLGTTGNQQLLAQLLLQGQARPQTIADGVGAAIRSFAGIRMLQGAQKEEEAKRQRAMAALLGITGESGGAKQQMLAAALDGMSAGEISEIAAKQALKEPKQELRTVGSDLLDMSGGMPRLLYRAPTPEITPYQAASLGLQSQGQQMAQASREDARQDRLRQAAEKKAESGATKYASDIESSGLAELKQQADLVNGLLPQEGNVPGFGYGAGVMPDFTVGDSGRDLRQAVAGLRNSILKARSGGAVTPQEADRFLQELGEGSFKSDDQLRTGITNINALLQSKLSNMAAGTSPEALDLYRSRGGRVLPSAIPQNMGGENWEATRSLLEEMEGSAPASTGRVNYKAKYGLE